MKLEQQLGFEELRKFAAPTTSIGSFGHDQATTMEEDTVEKQIEQARDTYLSFLSFVVRRKKLTHLELVNQNV